jgi:hypothetical protein
LGILGETDATVLHYCQEMADYIGSETEASHKHDKKKIRENIALIENKWV